MSSESDGKTIIVQGKTYKYRDLLKSEKFRWLPDLGYWCAWNYAEDYPRVCDENYRRKISRLISDSSVDISAVSVEHVLADIEMQDD